MGIIIRQSIKGSIWSYLGVGIGFITTSYLFPNYLSTETIGLFGLLLAWSILFAQFSSLGFNGVTTRLFPYFRDKEKGHNGYLFIALIVILVGFGLFLGAFVIFSPWLVENNLEKSRLFSDYYYLLIPLTFFTLAYSVLDSFNTLLFNAVFGTFLNEFIQRILIFIVVLLFIFGWFNLHQLILAYVGVVCTKSISMFIYLLKKGEISFKPKLNFIDKKLKREMLNVAFFSILTGIGGNFVFNIDKIIVNQMLGLSATGVYTIAFFFGTLVVIPSRPLLRISGTLIAEAWKKNDVPYITELYKKSCLNQFIIAAFLFGGIWVNIDNILLILGPDYLEGKWVIFFISLGYLLDLATGANGIIIAYSKYYRFSLIILLILLVLVLVSMYLLIPILGIKGAAIAIALSFFVSNSIKFTFLYVKYKMQPFTKQFIYVMVAFVFAYAGGFILPQVPLILDIIIRGGLFAIIYSAFIVGLKISKDVNATLNNFKDQFIRFLKK